MALSLDKRNRISEEVKKILLRRIENFPDISAENRNAPFHEAILDHFNEQFKDINIETPRLVAIASWMHGLNTSLGTGFEHMAHILSDGYKRRFTNAFRLKIMPKQAIVIEQIIRELKAKKHRPNMEREDSLIFRISRNDKEIDSLEFTTDVFIEKRDEIIAIEMKSVRPNSGEGRGEKQKILYGKAALKLAYPNKKIRFFLGFPFDPTAKKPTSYDKTRFFNYLIEFKKFFDPREVLVSSELWDYLSGSNNTMEDVLEVVKETVHKVEGK